MKVNVKQPIKNFDGTNLKRPTGAKNAEGEPILKEFTVEDACIDALNATFKDEENLSFDEKFKRFKLALKISDADMEGNVNLEPEEVAKIIELVGKGFAPIIVGRVSVILGKSIS